MIALCPDFINIFKLAVTKFSVHTPVRIFYLGGNLPQSIDLENKKLKTKKQTKNLGKAKNNFNHSSRDVWEEEVCTAITVGLANF